VNILTLNWIVYVETTTAPIAKVLQYKSFIPTAPTVPNG
jgi:hypothetical protein